MEETHSSAFFFFFNILFSLGCKEVKQLLHLSFYPSFKIHFSFFPFSFLVLEFWAIRNNAGILRRKTQNQKMEGNIKKGFHFAHIFKSTYWKIQGIFVRWKAKDLHCVYHTSDWQSQCWCRRTRDVRAHQGRSHSPAPPGSEASSALTHWKRIWWGRFHLCMRICLPEECLVLAYT